MPACMTRFTMFLLFFASAFCHAQATATCDHWTFFISFSASGINRWKTVVGTAPQSGGSPDISVTQTEPLRRTTFRVQPRRIFLSATHWALL